MANDSTLKSVIKFGIVINWMQLVYVSDNTCDFVPIKISMYICICSFRSHNAHQIDEKFTKNKIKNTKRVQSNRFAIEIVKNVSIGLSVDESNKKQACGRPQYLVT